jgi:hypothetical protein
VKFNHVGIQILSIRGGYTWNVAIIQLIFEACFRMLRAERPVDDNRYGSSRELQSQA